MEGSSVHLGRRLALAVGLAMASMLGPGAARVSAQAMLADDVIILSKGQHERKQAMEKAAASGGGPFPTSPDRARAAGGAAGPARTNAEGPAGTDGRALGGVRL